MAKIKINDLPADLNITENEMTKVTGGMKPFSGLLVRLQSRPLMTFKPTRMSLGPILRGGWDARPGGAECESGECST